MGPDMVADELNRLDRCGNRRISHFEHGDACLLTLAFIAVPIHRASTRVTRGQESEGASTLVLMFLTVGKVLRLSG